MATGIGRELEALDDVTAIDSVTDAAVVLTEFSKRMYCTYKYSLVLNSLLCKAYPIVKKIMC